MDKKRQNGFFFLLLACALLIYVFVVMGQFRAEILQKKAKILEGSFQEATKEMKKSLDADPEDAGAWASLGDLYWLEAREQDKTDEQRLTLLRHAEASFLEAVNNAPTKAVFHINLGLVRYEIANLEGNPPGPLIKQSFELAVELEPFGYYPHYLLGDYLLIEGKQKEAFTMFRKAIEAYPHDEIIKAIIEKAVLATKDYNELLLVIPEDVALAHLYFAAILRDKLGRWNECKMEFKKIFQLEPRNTYYRDYYLSYCISLGDVPSALEEVQARSEILGEDPKVLYRLADFLKNRGEFEQALQVCEKIQKLFPNFSDTVKLVGEIRSQQGNFLEAAKTYESYIRANPEDAEGYYGLGQLYRTHGNQYKAAELFSKAAILAPKRTRFQHAVADAYVKVGMHDRALEALAKCKMIDPEDVHAYLKSGRIYLRRKDWMDAAREFNEVLKRKPDNSDALNGFLKAESHIP